MLICAVIGKNKEILAVICRIFADTGIYTKKL